MSYEIDHGTKPTDRQLANLSYQLTKDEVYSLVVDLGLKAHEIESIEVDYGENNLNNFKFLCLRKWRNKVEDGSIQNIIEAAERQRIGPQKIYKVIILKVRLFSFMEC